MKTFKTLTLVFFMALSFVSCSSDDDTVALPTNAELVLGLWQLQSATQDGNPIALETCDLLRTIRFTAPNMFTQTFYTGANCEIITPLSGTYTIDDTNIMVNSGSQGTTVRIITLNETNLSVEFNEGGILVVDNYLKQL